MINGDDVPVERKPREISLTTESIVVGLIALVAFWCAGARWPLRALSLAMISPAVCRCTSRLLSPKGLRDSQTTWTSFLGSRPPIPRRLR
jgi:hypothetical protein